MRGRRSIRDRLLDIVEAISKARAAVGDRDLATFSESWLNQFAAERAIEIISEASRHLPEQLKGSAPQIPWRDIADIGNVLRHVYDRTDPEIVWRVVKYDLDPLEEAVNTLLRALPDDG